MSKILSKKEAVDFLFENDILVTEDIFTKIGDTISFDELCALAGLEQIESYESSDDFHISVPEKENTEPLMSSPPSDESICDPLSKVKVLFSYDREPCKREIRDFVGYFTSRLKSIEKMLIRRAEMQSLMSINKIAAKKDKEKVAIIGMVSDKSLTKNGNIVLTLEDLTGSIKVIITKSKQDLFEIGNDVVFDEVVGVVGTNGDNIIYCENLLLPDVPLNKEFKKSPVEEYAIFLSDIHVGSSNFLKADFLRFLKWLRGTAGNSAQRAIASKVKYIFIMGDLVDGVGIYPGQEDELEIKDIYDQYTECANMLKLIPRDKAIVICPGNHDAMRISEPQPPLYRDLAKPLYDIPNAVFVSNPATIRIGETKQFLGFDVVMYHGYSFDYYVANVDSIRNNGGYDRADLIMKFLLQRRHLAPAHTSTLYVPDIVSDSLVMSIIPDFFVAGHIHKCSVSNYRNVTLICGSCWQSITSFQEKVGHNPEPSRVPLVNLQTRKIKILRFSD